jgi:hypothetical protein
MPYSDHPLSAGATMNEAVSSRSRWIAEFSNDLAQNRDRLSLEPLAKAATALRRAANPPPPPRQQGLQVKSSVCPRRTQAVLTFQHLTMRCTEPDDSSCSRRGVL